MGMLLASKLFRAYTVAASSSESSGRVGARGLHCSAAASRSACSRRRASAYRDDGATLDHLHMAVAALEKIAPTARRVFGGAHPTTIWVEAALENARAALYVRRACSLLSGPLVFAFAVAAFAWVWRKYRS